MRVLVIGVKPWSMVDKETGEMRRGETVDYLDVEHKENDDRFVGFQAFKTSKPDDVELSAIPGIYDFDMSPARSPKGRMEMRLSAAQLVTAVDFEAMAKTGTAAKKSA